MQILLQTLGVPLQRQHTSLHFVNTLLIGVNICNITMASVAKNCLPNIRFPFLLRINSWFLAVIINDLRPPGVKATFPSLPCIMAEQLGSGQWNESRIVTFRKGPWREEMEGSVFDLWPSFYLLVIRYCWTEPHDPGKQGQLRNHSTLCVLQRISLTDTYLSRTRKTETLQILICDS